MKVKERVAVEVSHASSKPITPRRFNRDYLQVEKAIKLYRGRVENNRKKNQRLMAIMDVS